jgi:uncharacterized protein with HEPN domain
MSFRPREYLQHMLVEADFLLAQSHGITAEQFQRDEILQRAFVRSLEILGEATKKLPGSFRASHPEIEWRAMAGMRDHLIHGYFAVDYDLVWDVVRNKVPALRGQLRRILQAAE